MSPPAYNSEADLLVDCCPLCERRSAGTVRVYCLHRPGLHHSASALPEPSDETIELAVSVLCRLNGGGTTDGLVLARRALMRLTDMVR